MTVGIYKITNKVNGKCYIGQSQDIATRFREHKYLLRQNKYGNRKIQNAWNKYGEENFIFEIIEECTIEELDEKEMKYIKGYNSHYDGYNNTDGGGGIRGWKHSEEFKEKMSLSNKTNPRIPTQEQIERLIEYNKTRNYRHSEETKEKMRMSHLGLKATEEAKENMSIAQKEVWKGNEKRREASSRRFKENNPMKCITEEQRKEITERVKIANTGKKRSAETCKRIGNLNRDSKYMTDGKVNKRVKEKDFQLYLDRGFRFGRTKYWLKEIN